VVRQPHAALAVRGPGGGRGTERREAEEFIEVRLLLLDLSRRETCPRHGAAIACGAGCAWRRRRMRIDRVGLLNFSARDLQASHACTRTGRMLCHLWWLLYLRAVRPAQRPYQHQNAGHLTAVLLLCVPTSVMKLPQVHRVAVPELKRILRGGQVMLPSACTCYYALDELEQRGLL